MPNLGLQVPYMTYSYPTAMKMTFDNLDNIGKDVWYG